jgi:hypothetical protein
MKASTLKQPTIVRIWRGRTPRDRARRLTHRKGETTMRFMNMISETELGVRISY